MGRIYAKAQQEKMNRNLNEILAMLDNLKDENCQISKQKILDCLKEMMTENESQQSEIMGHGGSWNFSGEKAQSIFAEDDTIQLCPFSKGDDKFYFLIREHYKIFEKKFQEEQLSASYWAETQKDSTFYCAIVRVGDCTKLGYIALKNTSKDLWEIAIELDQKYCRCGYGQGPFYCFCKRSEKLQANVCFSFWWR